MSVALGRRGLLLGLLAAPVIVRAGSLMPVRNRWASGGFVWSADMQPPLVANYNWVVCGFDENGWYRREFLDARMAG